MVKRRYTDPEGICIICGYYGVDLHHVKTRGAGGTDEDYNLVPLCHAHHVEVDHQGDYRMGLKYPSYQKWLIKNDWKYNPITKKYYRELE